MSPSAVSVSTAGAGATYVLTFSASGLSAAMQNIVVDPLSFGTGTLVVGTEITAGLYRSRNAAGVFCYWERLSGFGGTSAERIANDIGGGPRLVEIAATDKGFSSDRCATWIEVIGPTTTSPTADFGEGVYMVGSDVAPGTWRSSGTGTSCYWARLSNFSGTNDLIANDIGPEPRIVTIAASDKGFLTDRCGAWKKQ